MITTKGAEDAFVATLCPLCGMSAQLRHVNLLRQPWHSAIMTAVLPLGRP